MHKKCREKYFDVLPAFFIFKKPTQRKEREREKSVPTVDDTMFCFSVLFLLLVGDDYHFESPFHVPLNSITVELAHTN